MEVLEDKRPVFLEDLGMHYLTENSKKKVRYGLYNCGYCGKEFKGNTYDIKRNKQKSCGCLRGIPHHLSKHKLYHTWANMVGRCTNPNKGSYATYGARGITICEEWLDVKKFIEWADSTYIEGMTLDRIDNDGNYEPSNCRWATNTEQTINQRRRYNNTSGYVGVCWSKVKGKWVSRIQMAGKDKWIGSFKTLEEAVQARDQYIIDNNLPHKLSKDYKEK
jgi:hypothetical protein